jgi:lysine 2,3-aminomutase
MLAEKIHIDNRELIGQNRLLLEKLWKYNRAIAEILSEAESDAQARNSLYAYYWLLERGYDLKDEKVHSLEWDLGRQCVRVAKNLISRRSQYLTGINMVSLLRKLARPNVSDKSLSRISPGFIIELERLWAGCRSRSGIYYGQKTSDFMTMEGREAAALRSENLDQMAEWMCEGTRRFATGLDRATVQLRQENKKHILKKLNASPEDWDDWHWQLRHVTRTRDDLAQMRKLTPEENHAVKAAEKHNIPFGITPYYLHLMDPDPRSDTDRAIRYQVIPPIDYVQKLAAGRRKLDKSFDFMQERDTSPIDLVTRRYPMICILKPYNTCAQICVYCQRNWEIEKCLDPRAMASQTQIEEALQYLKTHPTLKEVLVTGGDPLIMSDERLKSILDRLADIKHVERIRIGSRTPAVLPMRITDDLADLLNSYRVPGRRDVCVVTHFEHPYEVTLEAAAAVDRIRNRGISVYNQAVYTFANSRRFELSALRRILRLIGVDPYYTFTAKGKEETDWYRVPIARIQQERKEEARLTPGTWRTDDTVFNVPRLGKNYLNRQQDHEVIALLPDGRRVYEFHPWEKNLALVDTYLYTDVSIHEYLQRLEEIGEDPGEYKTIWYYF